MMRKPLLKHTMPKDTSNQGILPARKENTISSLVALPSTYQVEKGTYTLFNDAGAELVTNRGWSDLLITGIDTESCVLKTAVDAFEHDLTPWVLSDMVASHDGPTLHEAGLLLAGRFIGPDQIASTKEIVSRLGFDAAL